MACLAMSTTLAGNLTIPGSVANLIVIQKSRHAAVCSPGDPFAQK